MASFNELISFLTTKCTQYNYDDFKQYLDPLINLSQDILNEFKKHTYNIAILPGGGGSNHKLSIGALPNIVHMIKLLMIAHLQYNPELILKKKLNTIVTYLLTVTDASEHEKIHKVFLYEPIGSIQEKVIFFKTKEHDIIEQLVTDAIINVRQISDRVSFKRLTRTGQLSLSEWGTFIKGRTYEQISTTTMSVKDLKCSLDDLNIAKQRLLHDEEELILSEIESDLDEYF